MVVLSFLRSWSRRQRGSRPLSKPGSVRRPASHPALELLEDRLAPATVIGAHAGSVVDPTTATWYLHNDNTGGVPALPPFQYGLPGWVPLMGDWTGTGQRTIGTFDPTTATFYLRNSNGAGTPDIVFQYGLPGWIPLVGDWTGSGKETVGVFDPTTATFYLRNDNSSGVADAGVFSYGAPGWTPVVGNWTGQGRTTVGVIDPATSTWYLRSQNSAGSPDVAAFQFGARGWKPVAGDWNNTGSSGVGVFDPATGTFYLRQEVSAGAPDGGQFQYGGAGWVPVASGMRDLMRNGNAGFVGSQPLYDLAVGVPYGTTFNTPQGPVAVPRPEQRATATPVLTTDGAPAAWGGVPSTQQAPPGASVPAGFSFLMFNGQGDPLVNVHASLPKYLNGLQADLVQKLGFQPTGMIVDQSMVTGYLPVSKILALEQIPHFDSVTPVYQPRLHPDRSEGDPMMKAPQFRSQFNVDGTGVTVGVISDSVSKFKGGLNDSVKSGDLPPNVNVLKDGQSGDSDEGRAMLEIVHDVAPGSGLAFYTAGNSPQVMATAVQGLAAAGAKVITDDIGFGNEPMFNDGVVSKAINQVAAQGVFYTSAAGNDGNSGYSANWNGIQATVGNVTGMFQNVQNGSPLQKFTLPAVDPATGQPPVVQLGFQWDAAYQEGGAPGNGTGNYVVNNELEVLLTNATGTQVFATFNTRGPNVNEAYVPVGFQNPTGTSQNLALAFHLVKGNAPTMIRWIDDTNQYDPNALLEGGPSGVTVQGHPEAAGAVATGAVNATAGSSGAVGTVANYSAVGGKMQILFDGTGNRLPTPEIRQKPELAGPSSVHTSFFGDDDGMGGFIFTGTSAAAPHVAAAGALLIQQAGGNLTPAQILQQMEKTALDVGPPGVDNVSGFGLVQLAAVTPPTPADLAVAKTVNNPTPNVGDTVTFTVTLTDLGPNPATGVQVTDLLPAGLTFVSATPSQGTYNSGTGVWNVGAVDTTGARTLVVNARLDARKILTNTATITLADQPDPNPANNTASATVTPPGLSPPPPPVSGDIYDPNETSDKAYNFGTISTGTNFALNTNLPISNSKQGLPEYDWFRWTAGSAGTFTATETLVSGDLEMHLFTLRGNTLVELANSTAPGANTRTLARKLAAGQVIFVEIKGINTGPGVFTTGVYDLSVAFA
jgi:uncharacterized repeat protein (TIGR01451 family)